MNLHFLSFLLDIASWIVAGFIYGKYLSKFSRKDKTSSNIASLKVAFVALLGGLIATAEKALPSYGFAFYHFIMAFSYAFVYSVIYYIRFRKLTFKKIESGFKLLTGSALVRKNIIPADI